MFPYKAYASYVKNIANNDPLDVERKSSAANHHKVNHKTLKDEVLSQIKSHVMKKEEIVYD